MACIVMAYIVMAYMVMAYIVMTRTDQMSALVPRPIFVIASMP